MEKLNLTQYRLRMIKRRKQYKVKGIDTEKLKLLVSYLDNNNKKHLPVIQFRKVA